MRWEVCSCLKKQNQIYSTSVSLIVCRCVTSHVATFPFYQKWKTTQFDSLNRNAGPQCFFWTLNIWLLFSFWTAMNAVLLIYYARMSQSGKLTCLKTTSRLPYPHAFNDDARNHSKADGRWEFNHNNTVGSYFAQRGVLLSLLMYNYH